MFVMKTNTLKMENVTVMMVLVLMRMEFAKNNLTVSLMKSGTGVEVSVSQFVMK